MNCELGSLCVICNHMFDNYTTNQINIIIRRYLVWRKNDTALTDNDLMTFINHWYVLTK